MSLEEELGRLQEGAGTSLPHPQHYQDSWILGAGGRRQQGHLNHFGQVCKTVSAVNPAEVSFPATSHYAVLVKMVYSIPEGDERTSK